MNNRDIQLEVPKRIIKKTAAASEKKKEADGGLVMTVFKNNSQTANSSKPAVNPKADKSKTSNNRSESERSGSRQVNSQRRDASYGVNTQRRDSSHGVNSQKRDASHGVNYSKNYNNAYNNAQRRSPNGFNNSPGYYEDNTRDNSNGYYKAKLKKILIIIAIAAAFLIACFALYMIMTIKEIQIVGNENISTESIEALSGVDTGVNALLGVNEASIKSNIESNPRLELISVEYVFPSKLIITVKEHMPCADFYADGKYITIDSGGKVLDISAKGSSAKIIGLKAVTYKVNETIKTNNDASMESLKKLLSALESNKLIGSIKEIDITDRYSISYRYNTGMLVTAGTDEDIENKVIFADKVLEKLNKDGITTGRIDVSYSIQAVYTPAVRSAEEKTSSYMLNYNLYKLDDKAETEPNTAEGEETVEEGTNNGGDNGENG